MRQFIKILALAVFILLNFHQATFSVSTTPTKTSQIEPFPYFEYQTSFTSGIGDITYLDMRQKGPTYYVKIGDTISLLKDPQGYITAAIRLNMDTIKVVPDKTGKYYRTVSLDLKQSDEDLKQAIEVKVSEIIVK